MKLPRTTAGMTAFCSGCHLDRLGATGRLWRWGPSDPTCWDRSGLQGHGFLSCPPEDNLVLSLCNSTMLPLSSSVLIHVCSSLRLEREHRSHARRSPRRDGNAGNWRHWSWQSCEVREGTVRNPDLVGETRDAQETKRVATGETTGMGSEMGRAEPNGERSLGLLGHSGVS